MGFEDETTSDPIAPREEQVHNDNYVLNELKDILFNSRDAFGTLVADGRKNFFDLASHYRISPQRLRLFANGSRINPQYVDDARFTDAIDTWNLSPTAGDSMHIETAESVTYVVNYVVETSHAMQLSQELQDGDIYRFGPFDGTDGWVLEQRGSDHTPTQVDIIEYKGGVRTTLQANAELSKPLTDWTRFQANYNWYNVGEQKWVQTYTEDGLQYNDTIARTSNDEGRGPNNGNLNVWSEIVASDATTNLTLEGGSMGSIILGTPRSINKAKPQPIEVTPSGTADTWEPIYAIRVNPNNDNVNSQFKELDILDYGPNATIELVLVGFDPDNTDIAEADWKTPDYHHEQNSALQDTFAVSEVANTDGTQKVLTAGEKFGGITVMNAININGGNISGSSATQTSDTIDRDTILASDHYVLLARTGTSGTLWFEWQAQQNW